MASSSPPPPPPSPSNIPTRVAGRLEGFYERALQDLQRQLTDLMINEIQKLKESGDRMLADMFPARRAGGPVPAGGHVAPTVGTDEGDKEDTEESKEVQKGST